MIDWVAAELPCLHEPINGGSVVKIQPDGTIDWEAPCRVEVVGSYDANAYVRSSGGTGNGRATHLHFSANPAKYLQGHNIFGTDDLVPLMFDTFMKICAELGLQPTTEDIQSVQSGNYRVTWVDINYSYALRNRADVRAWLRAAELKSCTRQGRPVSKGGTVYWNKTSKRWAIKAYSKGDEIEAGKKHRLPPELQGTPLPAWADNKLRIELRIKSKEFDDMGLGMAAAWTPERVKQIYTQYLERIDMSEQIVLTDEQMMKLPNAVRSTYVCWQEGRDLRPESGLLTKRTYYRHRKILRQFGIDIAVMPDKKDCSNVVPLIRVLEAQPAEIPAWAFELGFVHSSTARKIAC